MAILDIRLYPDPALGKICDEVSSVNKDIHILINNMIDTMINAEGVGLSAPQVGVTRRIIVLDGKVNTIFPDVTVFINPKIFSREGEVTEEEGCLSMPDIFIKVKRAEKIHVKCLDGFGKELVFEAKGFMSRVLQHEIDHLDGFLFWDRVGVEECSMLKKEFGEFGNK